MRLAVTAAVLLAVVATALVAVCQHSQTRHLEYRVWQLERRRQGLERTRRRLTAAIEAARTPRRLLSELDGHSDPVRPGVPAPAWRAPAGPSVVAPVGFDPGNNFEGVDR